MRKNPQKTETTKISQIVLKDKNTILQGNAISRSLYSCPVLARKVIMYASLEICTTSNLKKVNTVVRLPGTDVDLISPAELTAKFKISDFIKALNLSDSGENYEIVRKVADDILSQRIVLANTTDQYIAYNWFSSVIFDKNTDTFELTFAQQVGYAILNHTNGYTSMKLNLIGQFKSIYTLRYYEIAMSYKGNMGRFGNESKKWFFQYTFEELRNLFQISKDLYTHPKYGNRNFFLKVVKEPIDELNHLNNDFKIEIEKILQGRKAVGAKFICSKLLDSLKIEKTDSLAEKQEKQVINEDWAKEALWEKMQKAHPRIWKKYFDEEKNKDLFVFDPVAKNSVYERMLSEGYKI